MLSSLTTAVIRGAGLIVAPGGRRGRLVILIYHQTLRKPDPLRPSEVDGDAFTWHMEALAKFFNVIPLNVAVHGLRTGTLPPRAACITFDDGYVDNVEVALPVLQRLKLPATFFIATAFLNGGRMWNDTVIESVRRASSPRLDLKRAGLAEYSLVTTEERRSAIANILSSLKYLPPQERQARVEEITDIVGERLPDDLMMRTEHVRTLVNAGMEIGAHTVNHPILRSVSSAEARDEIATGKEYLQAITGQNVRLFAYPNGKPGQDYSDEHVEIVRDLGFEGAVSTTWGAGRVGGDRYQLPRFTPWDRSARKFVARLLLS